MMSRLYSAGGTFWAQARFTVLKLDIILDVVQSSSVGIVAAEALTSPVSEDTPANHHETCNS